MTRPSSTTRFAWHGLELHIPSPWNPVKLDGSDDAGHVLIADIHGPQMGLRWRRVSGKKLDAEGPEKWARRAIEAEVGKAAAERAKHLALTGWEGSMIWLGDEESGEQSGEPAGGTAEEMGGETPGENANEPAEDDGRRDVWVGYSAASGRVVEIVRHVRRRQRGRTLEAEILPTLRDTPVDRPRAWALFDLSCVVPAGYALASHRLNAGDVGLTFSSGRKARLTIRQIALARLALARMPLESWLAAQEAVAQKYYRAAGEAETVEIGEATGLSRQSLRRRRFAFMRWLPASVVTVALHDLARDRLVLAQGSEGDDVLAVAETAMGWSPKRSSIV